MIAHGPRGLGEFRAVICDRQRGHRVIARPPALERIAALADLAIHISGVPGNPGHIFETVEKRLQLVIGDGVVTDGHVFGDNLCAPAVGNIAAQPHLHRLRRQF